ncbi:hypothetical protein H2202_002987 [Exophiala xenobiotica]|nr:hypothetical protein H2202_002987 [Exophiala xenobiotica]
MVVEEPKSLAQIVVQDYDDGEARGILRKVDFRLLPMLALLYVLAFLDRGNIGNAKVAGMNTDLKLTGPQYNIALTVFFLPYATFEIPSNIILKRTKPSTWIMILVLSWGTVSPFPPRRMSTQEAELVLQVMTLAGIVQNFHGLLISRFFLGLTETGFFPAATYLLTTWYTRFELQTRLAIFYSSGAFGGAFSGLLAFAIEHMNGVGGLEGWRWIFILEGLFTVAVALTLPWTLPNSPESARFLTPGEKTFLQRRLVKDSGTRNEPFKWKYLKDAALEWRIYVAVIVYWGNSVALYAFLYACPSIILDLGYTSAQAQLLTVPIYVLAMVSTIALALFSDKRKTRWLYIVIPYSCALIGFLACLCIPHPRLPGLTYAFLFFIPAGVYPPLMGIIAWVANNLAPSWKRAIGMAMLCSIGSLGSAIGSNLFLQEQKPRYWLGYGFCAGTVLSSILATLTLRYSWTKINAQRDRIDEAEVRANYTEEELNELGDKSPLFRYAI